MERGRRITWEERERGREGDEPFALEIAGYDVVVVVRERREAS